jgi:hypothetical protein
LDYGHLHERILEKMQKERKREREAIPYEMCHFTWNEVWQDGEYILRAWLKSKGVAIIDTNSCF